jgi:hypothetical protein
MPRSGYAEVVLFRCPACRQVLVAGVERTWKEVRCWGCGRRAVVPAADPPDPLNAERATAARTAVITAPPPGGPG